MKHSTKTVELVSLKALGPADGEPEGTFEAVFAAFGNVDKMGDRINGKAFDNTIEEWRSKAEDSGARIPVIFAHDWGNPMSYIGSADPKDLSVIPGRGIYAKGQIEHMDTNPVARQVHNLMKSRVVNEFSFGYNVPKGGQKKASDGAMDLNEINLYEFGPCLRGINPETELLGVKAALAEQEHSVPTKSYVDLEVAGSFEETQDLIGESLREVYPPPTDPGEWRSVTIVATTPSEVTYQICSSGSDDDEMWSASYTIDNGEVTLGDPTPVKVSIVPKAEKEDKPVKNEAGHVEQAFELAHQLHPDGVPSDVTKAIFADAEEWVKANRPLADVERETWEGALAEQAKAWDEKQHAFFDDQLAKASIVDRALGNPEFEEVAPAERYALPIAKAGDGYAAEPDIAACASAALRLPTVKASSEAVQTAAKRLERAFQQLELEVPPTVKSIAHAEVLLFTKGKWVGELSLGTIQDENAKTSSELERLVWEQSIEASEQSIGPLTADAMEAQRLNDQLTDRLLNELM